MSQAEGPVPAGIPVGSTPASGATAPEAGNAMAETASSAGPMDGAATVFPGPSQGGPFDSVERLRILETLSYGILYEGRVFHASRPEEVSLLELDAAFESEPETFARILSEIVAASRFERANALAPRGVFRHGDGIYVLFDACAGVSLATAFEFLGPAGLRLSSEAILRIASGVLAALDSPVREGGEGEPEQAHGLLTPENIFVAEGQRVLVRGFGMWPGGAGRLGLLGPRDRRYIAPSQTHSGAATPRTDLLSLGMILFEGLVGVPAFDSPPEDEDLADLRGSIGEFQAKAEPGLSELFEITMACLTPPASLTLSYRSRLRKRIDTVFLREFTRDKAPKMINLEDLVARIKPRRPVIVKARPIALAPAAPDIPEAPLPDADRTSEEASDEFATLSMKADFPVSEESAAPARTFSYPPMTFGGPPPRRRGLPRSALVALVLAAAVVAGALAIWRPRPASPEETAAALERVVVLPPPTAAKPAPSPLSLAPVPPPPAPAPTAKPSTRAAAPRQSRDEALGRSRRAAAARDAGKKRDPAPRRERVASSSGPAAPPPPAPADRTGDVPAVAAGALVSFRTAGLVAPVLIANPPPLRFQESDPRPARAHEAALEILVSDSGRVRGSRILRADSFPPGFT
ncbi:MAG TPA: hypothetical protein VKE50_00535, partial [Thermoanaerobaculia bacterium]|nr:hypothetical protein [Thermoanaerobaculia bacterium]